MTPLNPKKLHALLTMHPWRDQLDIHCLASIASTNDYLKTTPTDKPITLCCAESQTQGRGRFGRQWVSPPGGNLYCSLKLSQPLPATQLGPLSLLVGLATLMALNQPPHTTLKWPNDVMYHDQKCGGILIELTQCTANTCTIIIGLGLNLHTLPLVPDRLHAVGTLSNIELDRYQLLAAFLMHLERIFTRFYTEGWEAFAQDWHAVDYLYGKPVTLVRANQPIAGKACGVNEQGHLRLLEDTTQEEVLIESGEATLRGE